MKVKNCSAEEGGREEEREGGEVVSILTMLGLIVQGGRLPCHGMLSCV